MYWQSIFTRFVALVLAFLGAATPSLAAETIKLGTAKLTATGPIYIAQAKGYFAAEGLTIDLADIDVAPAIAVAVTSGSLDIGDSAFSAAFFSLAGQGALKIIGGQARDVPASISLRSSPRIRLTMAASRAWTNSAATSSAIRWRARPSNTSSA